MNLIPRSIDFSQGVDGTFAGNISGRGSLVKTGVAALILAGDNNYTNGTTVSAGTPQGTSRSLQGNILNNAAVVFDQSFDGTYAGSLTGSGTLAKNGVGPWAVPVAEWASLTAWLRWRRKSEDWQAIAGLATTTPLLPRRSLTRRVRT
jgi:autotransporter-associated beta strand protein